MSKPIAINYKGRNKEFYISENTNPEIFALLIKKAFRIKEKIQGLANYKKKIIHLKDVTDYIESNNQNAFDLKVLQEYSQQFKSKDEIVRTYSKKNLSKSSGRKVPPQQSEILDQKYFIDDFQLFMSEVHQKHSKKIFGIIFFEDHKNCMFLGKKILRELIFQYGSIEFYYSIYPSKKGSRTKLLGPTLVFSIFHGEQLILQRDFPQNLTATEEISGLLKYLLNSGELDKKIDNEANKANLVKIPERNFPRAQSGRQIALKNSDNKIFDPVNEEYSIKISNVNEKVKDSEPIKYEILIKNNSFSKQQQQQKNPTKVSKINEISFQHAQIDYPSWFFGQQLLDSLQKGAIIDFINQKNEDFLKLCRALDFTKQQKLPLNLQIIKIFCQFYIEKYFKVFSHQQVQYIENNKNNRMNIIFNLILKFKKLGNINQLVTLLKQEFQHIFKVPEASYTNIAHNLSNQSNTFRLKLFQDQAPNQNIQRQQKLISKIPHFNQQIKLIADNFHYSQDNKYFLSKQELKRYQSVCKQAKLTDQEIKKIINLLINGDPFIRKELNKDQFVGIELSKILRKLLQSKKYQNQLLQELESPSLIRTRQKISKFTNFKSLISYLYEYKRINKKQEKLFFYLYIWEDMNILGAFESYLLSHDLEEFIETIYIIDQIYYMKRKYGMELTEIERFNDILEHQLSIIFTHKDEISLQNRLALEKLVRAGDTTIIKFYTESKGNKKDYFFKKINEYAENKRVQLQELENARNLRETKQKVLKEQRNKFLNQIIPVHFKKLINPEIVFQCLEKDEPILDSIFQVYEVTQDLVDWIENFKLYCQFLPKIHCSLVIQQHLIKNKCSQEQKNLLKKLVTNENSLIIGIYEVYCITKDDQELEDSIKRVISKYLK